MNEIKIFKNPEFGQIRTMVMPDGQIGFVGKDVATVLGYSNATKAIIMHVEDDDKVMLMIEAQSQNGTLVKTKTAIINESGMYSLILSSKLPKARRFKHWVTAEVLPQIRQTGGYIPLNEEDDEKMILAKAVGIYQRTIEQKDRLIAEQRPKVLFADAVTSGDDSILISEMAKLLTQNGYEIGRNRFFVWLRENGYIFKHSTEPIQKWVERGIFDTHVTLINTHHGQQERITTKVTGKGQAYFINLFITNGKGV